MISHQHNKFQYIQLYNIFVFHARNMNNIYTNYLLLQYYREENNILFLYIHVFKSSCIVKKKLSNGRFPQGASISILNFKKKTSFYIHIGHLFRNTLTLHSSLILILLPLNRKTNNGNLLYLNASSLMLNGGNSYKSNQRDRLYILYGIIGRKKNHFSTS